MALADKLHSERVAREERVRAGARRTLVPEFMHELDELDPLISRIILWRYGRRGVSDQAIAQHIGWPVERVVAVSDQALHDVWARVAVEEAA